MVANKFYLVGVFLIIGNNGNERWENKNIYTITDFVNSIFFSVIQWKIKVLRPAIFINYDILSLFRRSWISNTI